MAFEHNIKNDSHTRQKEFILNKINLKALKQTF